MPLIPFPSVPSLPGVPSIPRDLQGVITQGSQLASRLFRDPLPAPVKPNFGITFAADGKPALVPDSFVSVDYEDNSVVSSFPIEKGSFSTLNKVDTPYSLVVTATKGGTINDRIEFFAACRDLRKSLALVNISAGDYAYFNLSLSRIARTKAVRNGTEIVIVHLYFVEVRIAPLPQFNEPANNVTPLPAEQVASPSAASPVSNGQVQLSPGVTIRNYNPEDPPK